MKRKAFRIVLMIAAVTLALSAASFAADQKTQTTAAKKTVPATMPMRPMPPKSNFGMIAGTVESIDNTDPANIKIMVKNDSDGAIRAIAVTPWTNITKVTDVSELKAGEPVRMMTRKVEDKDVAMGIMFGKVKTPPPQAPRASTVQKAPAAAVIKK